MIDFLVYTSVQVNMIGYFVSTPAYVQTIVTLVYTSAQVNMI